MIHEFHVVAGPAIRAILDEAPQRSIECIRAAYLAHHDGQTINPDSYFLRFPSKPQNRIIALPASIEAGIDVSGIKWIASFPENIKAGLARASATLILNDSATGYPFACMEGSHISAVRTAASAVLAARALNADRRIASDIAFVGAGIIAKNILEMFCEDGWAFEQIYVHDLDSHSAQALRDYAERRSDTAAFIEDDLNRALRRKIVVLATTASTPYVVPPIEFEAGQIILNVSLRDIAPELLLNAMNIVDDVDHCLKANTSPHLAEMKFGHRDFISGTIAQLLRGEIAVDSSRPLIFSPFGLGVLDLALGKLVFDEAHSRNMTTLISDFFHDIARW